MCKVKLSDWDHKDWSSENIRGKGITEKRKQQIELEISKLPSSRSEYEKFFQKYPDLVNLSQFREMLGGLGDHLARGIVNGGHITVFKTMTKGYMFPKTCVIDYMLSDHYKDLLRARNLHVGQRVY